jgi:hypothetical protein
MVKKRQEHSMLKDPEQLGEGLKFYEASVTDITTRWYVDLRMEEHGIEIESPKGA